MRSESAGAKMKPSEMTNEELGEALAIEGMGWKLTIGYDIEGICELDVYEDSKNESIFITKEEWNPAEDLNQVHLLEEKRKNDVLFNRAYMEHLNVFIQDDINGYPEQWRDICFAIRHASARRCCEALLTTFREVKK